MTVVVARFDDLLGAGLHQLIEGDSSLEIVAKGVEQSRIPVVLRAHRPDVAILDLAALAKPAEVRELTTAQPQTRLVLLASELTAVESAQLLAFGASACLRRDTQSRDVLSAIHLAARGMQLIPRVVARLAHPPAGGQLLTRREAELLPLLQQAQSNSQIAQTPADRRRDGSYALATHLPKARGLLAR